MCSYKGTSHIWLGAHSTPVWPHHSQLYWKGSYFQVRAHFAVLGVKASTYLSLSVFFVFVFSLGDTIQPTAFTMITWLNNNLASAFSGIQFLPICLLLIYFAKVMWALLFCKPGAHVSTLRPCSCGFFCSKCPSLGTVMCLTSSLHSGLSSDGSPEKAFSGRPCCCTVSPLLLITILVWCLFASNVYSHSRM